ncbi:MAG: hypothetical protein HY556_10985 [Euryarchaeota archaeon]|nr:hypothetical protein [Euryarchaeota archaeon]
MKVDLRRAVAISVVFLLIAVALVPYVLSPGRSQLSAYGGRADLSRFRETIRDNGLEAGSIVSSPLVLNGVTDANDHLYVAIGVEREFLGGEIEALLAFHSRGGSILVADDFGYANALSREFGVSFDRRALRDESFTANPLELRNQSLVPVNLSLEGRNWSILTDVPTSLGISPGADGETVARTTPAAYVDSPTPSDQAGNGVKDGTDFNDPRGFAVAYVSKDRRVAFVSDPQIFSNELMLRSDYENQEMAERLVLTLFRDAGGSVLIDESRHAPAGDDFLARLLISAGVVPTQDALLRVVVLVGALVAAVLAMFMIERPKELLSHEPLLDVAVPHPNGGTPISERLRESAIHKVKIVNGIDNDAWRDLGPEGLSRLVGDERLRQLIYPGGEVKAAEVADLIGRIKDYKT